MERDISHYSLLQTQEQQRKAIENQIDPRLLEPTLRITQFIPLQAEIQIHPRLQEQMENPNPDSKPPPEAQIHDLGEEVPINTIRFIPHAKNNHASAYQPATENENRPAAAAAAETGGSQQIPPKLESHGLPLVEDFQHAPVQSVLLALGNPSHVNPLHPPPLEEAKINPIKFMAQGHIPDQVTDPFTRLRCFTIDFVLSPSLIASPHNPGPYFPDRCYMMEFSNARGNLDQVIRAYGLFHDIDKILIAIDTCKQVYADEPGYVYYSVECSADTFYASGNPLKIPMSDGAFPVFNNKLGPVWRVEIGSVEDFSAMSWECVVQLLATYTEIAFYSNGTPKAEINARNIAATIDGDNLEHVGRDTWRIVRLGGFGHTLSSLSSGGGEGSLPVSPKAGMESTFEGSGCKPS